ncbi:MAG TPA: CCA tRNA nucleotidyltransferase, partial [Acidimicrobiales bacterium]|nr:CCA tRNA nucleotidyltransferase [Acidimicrobiales bacterium]
MVPERLRPVLDEANELARLFAGAGFRLYLVGGVVRDALLDRLNRDGDLDFTTDALPDQTEALLASWADATWAQGKRFGTNGAAKGQRRLEVTTHRAEEY